VVDIMTAKRKRLTFSELDELEPRGKHAILRTAEEILAEQAPPDRSETEPTPPAARTADPVSPLAVNRARYAKATYRLSPVALDAIEESKRLLRRQYGIKVNLEEIAEEAILAAYRDLIDNAQHSHLVQTFAAQDRPARKPVPP
jgi:hypothetical protein